MGRLLPAVMWCVPLLAQFDNLVTNDDGSVLYFSSTLRMRGTNQFTHRKLFVLDSKGLRLHMQRPLERVNSPDATWPVSNYHSLESVALNASGSTVAVIARRDCYGGSGCLPTPKFRSEVEGREFRGRMSLSRNGRFALLWGDAAMPARGSLVDLETGRTTTIGPWGWTGRYGRRHVSSGGTAVVPSGAELLVVGLDGERRIALPEPASDPVIDDAASTAVYQAGTAVRMLNLETGAVRTLATASGVAILQPCLSTDGRVVTFLLPTDEGLQLFVVRPESGTPRRLTTDPSGIREIVMSGDGRVAYAVTASGRLLRVSIETAMVEERIGQSVHLDAVSTSSLPYPVPGSALTITGSGLSLGSAGPAPEVLLDGQPAPLLSVTPGRMTFQIPWETAVGKHRLDVRAGAGTVFETEPLDFEILHTSYGQFETLDPTLGRSVSGSPFALAAHSDFGSLVTRANPARPGQIIHLYMTGLGPVEPSVPTGEPAPSNPPARVRAPLTCTFAPPNASVPETLADVLYAGLAPLYVGYYQVSIRIPESVSIMYGDALLACRSGEAGPRNSAWLPIER
jgi:uncharacterized protein (TIGR03437 family)